MTPPHLRAGRDHREILREASGRFQIEKQLRLK